MSVNKLTPDQFSSIAREIFLRYSEVAKRDCYNRILLLKPNDDTNFQMKKLYLWCWVIGQYDPTPGATNLVDETTLLRIISKAQN